VPFLRAIASPSVAEYNGKRFNAFAYFLCHDGRDGGDGLPEFGVYVDSLTSILTPTEIAQFDGPPLSWRALHKDALKLEIHRNSNSFSFSARLYYSEWEHFKTGFNLDGHFATNIGDWGATAEGWRGFLHELDAGFTEGEAILGVGFFAHPLVVHITGEGIAQPLAGLLNYCRVR